MHHRATPHKLSTSLEDGPKDLGNRTKIVSEKSTTFTDEIVLYKYPLFPHQVQSRDSMIETMKMSPLPRELLCKVIMLNVL